MLRIWNQYLRRSSVGELAKKLNVTPQDSDISKQLNQQAAVEAKKHRSFRSRSAARSSCSSSADQLLNGSNLPLFRSIDSLAGAQEIIQHNARQRLVVRWRPEAELDPVKSEQSAPGRDPNISVSGLSDGRDLTNEAVLYSPGSVAVL